jgi:hypothetical protein
MKLIDGIQAKFRLLAEKKITKSETDKTVENLLNKVYRLDSRIKKDGESLSEQSKRVIETVSDIFFRNINELPGKVAHTAYGLFQSITYYQNHSAQARVTEQAKACGYDTQDARQVGMFLPNGTGFKTANQAFDLLVNMSK